MNAVNFHSLWMFATGVKGERRPPLTTSGFQIDKPDFKSHPLPICP